MAKEGLDFLWLRDPGCLAGGLRGLKPTPNVFSFGEKADSAGKGLVCTGPSDPTLRQLGRDPARPDFRHSTLHASGS